MKIYLVRHGQTDWNYQKKIQGQQDVDINEQGIRQAEKLAEILKNVPFEYAVCSPLTRAHHTAEILLKYHSVPLSYDERLKEIYLGEWEGKTHKEVMTQEKNPVWQYFHCPENYHPDGDMESLEKLYRRGEAFVREVLFPLEDHYETILVVAHCEFPYKSRVMGTSEPLKPLKAPYMARNPVKWGFFRLKGQEIPLKI